jgi:hypothetical protein
MTEQPYNAARSTEVSQFGMQALWRLTSWGGLATFALFAAVISAYSNAGSQRQAAAATSGQGIKQPRAEVGDFAAQPSETAEETRRVAETVRNLAADRDQVLTRIAALERNLDGVTGSIKRDRIAGSQPSQQPALPQIAQLAAQQPVPQQSPQPIAQQTLPQNPAPTTAAVPVARPELPVVTEGATSPAQTAAPQQSGANQVASAGVPDAGNRAPAPPPNLVRVAVAEPLPAATGLGVDVGGATNYEGLRTLWHSTKNGDPALLADFYPVVAVRENGKTHGVDLRLVIGPIVDAEAASHLCTTLAEAHHYCQPVAFEGQRLSMIDTAPAKAAPPKADPSPHHASYSHGGHADLNSPFSNVNYPHGK